MKGQFYKTPDKYQEIKKGYGYYLYKSDDDDYLLEAWGSSTKHPDFNVNMKDDTNFCISEYVDIKYQVFQWLLYRASCSMFGIHAHDLATFAFEYWDEITADD